MKNGVYAAYKVSKCTAANIIDWAVCNGFQHIMRPEKMHVTTMYSRVPVYYEPSNRTIGAQFDHFKLFPEKTDPTFGTLVAALHSPALVERFNRAIAAGATTDYPEYIPHISLARLPMSTDLSKLPAWQFPVVLSHEYSTLMNPPNPNGQSGYQLGNELKVLAQNLNWQQACSVPRRYRLVKAENRKFLLTSAAGELAVTAATFQREFEPVTANVYCRKNRVVSFWIATHSHMRRSALTGRPIHVPAGHYVVKSEKGVHVKDPDEFKKDFHVKDPSLYYIQPDGTWVQGGDCRSPGKTRAEIESLGGKIVG